MRRTYTGQRELAGSAFSFRSLRRRDGSDSIGPAGNDTLRASAEATLRNDLRYCKIVYGIWGHLKDEVARARL
jgi:hypothetical protein